METSQQNLKNQRKRKTKSPCGICFLHLDLCICAQIPRLDLKTRLCLVVHAKELKRTTNTGRLAIQALANSEMHIRGATTQALDLTKALDKNYESFFLYPADDALELSPEWLAQREKPVQLIVPDGNWRQASKVYGRHPELRAIPLVMVKNFRETKAFLRAEHLEHGMATLQAIAYAFGAIEGEEVERRLLGLYEAKLKATLRGRGVKPQGGDDPTS